MKNLLIATFLVFSISSFSQTSINLTVNGLSDEVNSKLKKGEHLKNCARLDKRSYLFYAKVQNTEGGTTQYVQIQNEVEPNDEGNYSFSLPFIVKQKGTLDFSKEIIVVIEGFTTFGNDVWAEDTISPKDFGKPLIMDSYGNKFRSYRPEKTKIACKFIAPKNTSKLGKQIIAQGDDTKVLTSEDFHVQMKNKGDDKWIVNHTAKEHFVNSGKTLTYTIDPETTKLNLDKPILVHVCATTLNGGFVWNEWTLQPWELGDNYKVGKNYTIERLCEESPLVETIPEKKEKEEEKQEEKQEEKKEDPAEKVEKKTKEDIEVKTNKPPVSEKPVKVEKCNTDSLTKLLPLVGGKLCANNIKVSRGTTNSAMLLFNSNYSTGGNMFPLKGGKRITYHNKKNYLLSATLDGSVTINHAVGKLALKPYHKIAFSASGISGVKLANNTSVNFKGTSLMCKVTRYDYDIEFDALGRLSSLTLAEDAVWNISSGDAKLPSESELFFKSGYLARIKCKTPTQVTLAGQTFNVVSHKKKASLEFKKANELNAIVVGEGHTVEVAGYTVNVETSSQLGVVYNGSAYTISSVVTNEPITVDVNKGSKVKSVDAKAGKRLIIKEGKIVKVK